MRQVIDIDGWERKEEYLFFKEFQSPLISITVEVDCTAACRKAKEQEVPVSLYYLHAGLVAANRIKELRYREENGEVVLYDRVDLLTPIFTKDENYRSVVLPYREDFEDFLQSAMPIVEKAKTGEGQAHGENKYGKDLILISVNPWYRFTSVQLSIPRNPHENLPIFTFGKLTFENNKWLMPVALNVSHGFMDGFRVGRFLAEFQQILDR